MVHTILRRPSPGHRPAFVVASAEATTGLAGGVLVIGELTRAYRQEAGLTQEELAERTGISSRTIRAIESGRSPSPRRITVGLLADVFGLSGTDRERFYASAASWRLPAPAPRSTAPPAAGRSAGAMPDLLPVVADFVGRHAELERLNGLLDRQAGATVVVSGTAGVGKTTLAVHWGRTVAGHFPDGRLYVNLRGFDPAGSAVSPAEALRNLLGALGVPTGELPPDLPGRTSLYRRLLADQRVLVVVDNAVDAAQVRPLIAGTAGCLTLVTSRRQLAGLVAADGAVPLSLDLLTVEESRQLLVRRLGPRRISTEPVAVDALVARSGRLPLALAVVAARAAINPTFSLAGLVGQMDRAENRLDALHGTEAAIDVRTVLSWSYRQLRPTAARLFRLLGLHPGLDFAAPAAASLVGTTVRDVEPLLAELADAHLVTEPAPGRYGLHDLWRSYATELVGQVDSAVDRRAALRRLLDHCLHTSATADRALGVHRDRLALPPPVPGAVCTGFSDSDPAMRWFDAEFETVLGAIRIAAELGLDGYVWRLAANLRTYLHRQGRWPEMSAVHLTALRAARRMGDLPMQARSDHHIGEAAANLDRFDEAHHHLRRADRCYAGIGDRAGQARVALTSAYALERQQLPDQALGQVLVALRLAREAADPWLQARAHNAVGWYHALLGEPEQTRLHCVEALILFEELDDPDGAADTWDSIGFANHRLGRHSDAVDCYQRALRLYRASGNRFFEAATLTHLGHAHLAAGDVGPAQAAWRAALDTLDDLGHRDAFELRTLLRSIDHPPGAGTSGRPGTSG
ncbi:helix-turn-helix domain-containing protein [Solwaraspora sp. WMMD792]|uniref:ATP-binding protein n=1 Tax=Solwaraspora sp. WMMD792 TaxID=3016099 RepID=UPI002416BB78|nr:helix-turn-helix domain-containing protein [Solwaraspora sp. WMMD792]MDG4771376.1 helix-turn-helix domain-containing protein [Solwaraspora sp. WMMD792]